MYGFTLIAPVTTTSETINKITLKTLHRIFLFCIFQQFWGKHFKKTDNSINNPAPLLGVKWQQFCG